MDAIGAQEVHFPALLPREPYEATGRWTEYGDGIFRLKDRKGNDYLLGPTHEEMFTLLVKDLYSSYKDLPLSIYQIQTKYRDEARPRAGLLRGREFVMKDSYSFDVDDAACRPLPAHRDAYLSTFDRLGLDYVIVAADVRRDGRLARARSSSRPTEIGEDTFVRCTNGDYAANVEAVRPPVPPPMSYDDAPAAARRGHPGHPDHRDPRRRANARARAPTAGLDRGGHAQERGRHRSPTPTATASSLAVGLPGDREVDLKRARGRSSRRPRSSRSTRTDFAEAPALVKGYIGPASLGEKKRVRHPLPPRPAGRRRHRAGSPAPTRPAGTSSTSSPGRDFTADGTIEAAEVRDGDPCPTARRHRSRPPAASRSATSSSSAASTPRRSDLKVLDENGKQVVVTMGSYGIGVSRAVAAIAEEHQTSWACAGRARSPPPTSTSSPPARTRRSSPPPSARRASSRPPAFACSTTTGRRSRPGVKFKDAELLGVPTIVVVGRGLADGVVEVARPAQRASARRSPCEAATVVGSSGDRDRGTGSRRSSSTGAAP